MSTLNKIKRGKKVRVNRVTGDCALKHRIMDMGITKGVEIMIKKFAPFGDPLEISVRGYNLSLRKNEAKNIVVEY